MNLIQKQNAFIPFLFDDFINREFNLDKSIFETLPAVNIKELDSLFQIELAVPGKNKNDFQIEIEDGLLTISSNVPVVFNISVFTVSINDATLLTTLSVIRTLELSIFT